MSSLLDAANVSHSLDKFVTDALPTKPGDISVMTIEQIYTALHKSASASKSVTDPSMGYNSSTYYVYGIVGLNGDNSTSDNLQKVSIHRYKQKNKPNTYGQMFASEEQILFGGPLYEIVNYHDDKYDLSWYFNDEEVDYSSTDIYWNGKVPGSVYVTVVNAKSTVAVTSSLPVKSGDVSIMTLKEAYIALEGIDGCGYDPSHGYNTSTYYVYAIDNTDSIKNAASKSTSANLQDIDINWYKQLNKPATSGKHWIVNNLEVFGGPLLSVDCDNDRYNFVWYYTENDCGSSDFNYYWHDSVTDFVYVAVVRAR